MKMLTTVAAAALLALSSGAFAQSTNPNSASRIAPGHSPTARPNLPPGQVQKNTTMDPKTFAPGQRKKPTSTGSTSTPRR